MGMLANLESASAAADLATEIGTALAASGDATVSSMSPTVSAIEAAPEVTISYEISTTDATVASDAQATMAAAAASGTEQTDLIAGITSNLNAAGIVVVISNMTGTVDAVVANTPGAAAANASQSSSRTSSSAVRHSLRHVVMSVVVAVAGALAL